MAAIDVETMDSKEFAKLADFVSITGAKELIQLETDELENVYSDYFVEKKRRLEALKEIPQYAEDLLDIKAIKSAERDRIAPEKNLFDLALLCLEAAQNGDEDEVPHSKQFQKCIRSSGKEYTTEFINKDVTEWKDYCIRFYLLKRQVDAELKANAVYQAALDRKKSAEDDVKSDLKEMELKAALAIVEMKNRKNILEEDGQDD